MTKLKKTIEPDKPSCEMCQKDIPPSAAKSSEAVDYIHYFCGTECYAKWQQQKPDDRKIEQDTSDSSR